MNSCMSIEDAQIDCVELTFAISEVSAPRDFTDRTEARLSSLKTLRASVMDASLTEIALMDATDAVEAID